MKPNLKISNITRLSFSTTCILTEEILDTIKSQSRTTNGIYQFFDTYTDNRVSHSCILAIDRKKKDTGESSIHFEYALRPKLRLPKNAPRISSVIKELCKIGEEHEFDCSACIEFHKRDKKRFIINLPLTISRAANMPINIIDGFSIEGEVESLKYSVLIYTNDKGNEFQLISLFSKKYPFNEFLAQNTINDAIMIANALMSPIQ